LWNHNSWANDAFWLSQVANQHEDAGSKAKEYKAQLDSAVATQDELQRRVKDLETTNDTLESNLETATQKYTKMQTEHDQLVAELNDL
jgi:uncharacterized coiled-coil DUF342 family protein